MSENEKYHKVPVEEFTTPTPVTVESSASVKAIVSIMREHGVRHVPVVDNGKALGIISDRDIKLIGRFDGWMEFQASDVMSPDPYMVNPEATLDEVAFHMSKYKVGSALVQDSSGEVVGIFTSTDALNALIEVLRGEV